MKFSIVIPLYNKQNTIRRAIHSVLDQVVSAATQYEIIIVDDGSTDNSLAIVNDIQGKYTDREIVVYSQANAGVSAARNRGIELASTNFITFLDADDTYQPNFLSEIKTLIAKFPSAAMFATGYSFIDTSAGTKRDANIVGLVPDLEHQRLGDFFLSAAYGDLPVTSSSVCIAKKALNEIGGFPRGENMGEDQAVWAQIALIYSIAISTRVCANYFEESGNSLMQTVAPSNEMPFSKRLQQQLDSKQVLREQVGSLQCYIAGHLLDLVRRNLGAADIESANALVQDPRARRQLRRWLYWCLRVHMSRLVILLKPAPTNNEQSVS